MQVEASVGGDIFGLVYGKMSSDFATQPGYIKDAIRSVDVTWISCLITNSVFLCVYGIESFRHLHTGYAPKTNHPALLQEWPIDAESLTNYKSNLW